MKIWKMLSKNGIPKACSRFLIFYCIIFILINILFFFNFNISFIKFIFKNNINSKKIVNF
jgi:hypothetical protein